jgi:N-acetylmuramoyl-L-alanine amidase
MTPTDAFNISLLALCVWREARGEPTAGKQAVACSIRNRVQHPSWWGHSWASVILKDRQYSSFNRGDPNATKWPDVEHDTAWAACLDIASAVYTGVMDDNSGGADSYYDISIPAPAWATDDKFTIAIGKIRFYRLRP